MCARLERPLDDRLEREHVLAVLHGREMRTFSVARRAWRGPPCLVWRACWCSLSCMAMRSGLNWDVAKQLTNMAAREMLKIASSYDSVAGSAARAYRHGGAVQMGPAPWRAIISARGPSLGGTPLALAFRRPV